MRAFYEKLQITCHCNISAPIIKKSFTLCYSLLLLLFITQHARYYSTVSYFRLLSIDLTGHQSLDDF